MDPSASSMPATCDEWVTGSLSLVPVRWKLPASEMRAKDGLTLGCFTCVMGKMLRVDNKNRDQHLGNSKTRWSRYPQEW